MMLIVVLLLVVTVAMLVAMTMSRVIGVMMISRSESGPSCSSDG